MHHYVQLKYSIFKCVEPGFLSNYTEVNQRQDNFTSYLKDDNRDWVDGAKYLQTEFRSLAAICGASVIVHSYDPTAGVGRERLILEVMGSLASQSS